MGVGGVGGGCRGGGQRGRVVLCSTAMSDVCMSIAGMSV